MPRSQIRTMIRQQARGAFGVPQICRASESKSGLIGSAGGEIERDLAPAADLFCQLERVELVGADPGAGAVAPGEAASKVDEIDVLVIGANVRELDTQRTGELARLAPGVDWIDARGD